MPSVDVGQLYRNDVLHHGVGGHQSAPQQVGHHVYDFLVKLGKPSNGRIIFKSVLFLIRKIINGKFNIFPQFMKISSGIGTGAPVFDDNAMLSSVIKISLNHRNCIIRPYLNISC